MAAFAERFILGRLEGFEKDIRVCLTMVPRPRGEGRTCAYFPALSSCCSMLEYLSALHCGRLNGIGRQDVFTFAQRFMQQPDYDEDRIRVLVEAFRNRVNHRGIATGVWVDKDPRAGGRRLVWKILKGDRTPAIEVLPQAGNIVQDSPWPCRHTHRVHIGLSRLSRDIVHGGKALASAIGSDSVLERNFLACMHRLYPA